MLLSGCAALDRDDAAPPPVVEVTGLPFSAAPQNPSPVVGGMRVVDPEAGREVVGAADRVDVRLGEFENTVRIVRRVTGVEVFLRAPEDCLVATSHGAENGGSAFLFLTPEAPEGWLEFRGGCGGAVTIRLAPETAGALQDPPAPTGDL